MECYITTLSKIFLFSISLLLSFFFYFVFIHSKSKNNSILYTKTISTITKLPNLSYSTSFYEAQIKEYKDFSYKIYPQQLQLNYMEFVYEN